MFLPCLQAVLVASRKSLTQRKGVLDITHEILERLEAHLRAAGQLTFRLLQHEGNQCNMRGTSAEEVAERVLSQTSLSGLQGPTVSPVFWKRDGRITTDYYAVVICVHKKLLYKSVQQLRALESYQFILIQVVIYWTLSLSAIVQVSHPYLSFCFSFFLLSLAVKTLSLLSPPGYPLHGGGWRRREGEEKRKGWKAYCSGFSEKVVTNYTMSAHISKQHNRVHPNLIIYIPAALRDSNQGCKDSSVSSGLLVYKNFRPPIPTFPGDTWPDDETYIRRNATHFVKDSRWSISHLKPTFLPNIVDYICYLFAMVLLLLKDPE
ncbi:hypothetical protein C3L33_21257, partial [Rhododendron williamsianum]